MPRYFIEVAYKGTNYAGFQIQDNANTIQAEVEKALSIFLREPISLTGSSRTDAGVHARQNYFHFETEKFTDHTNLSKPAYHLNAILPGDIAVLSVHMVSDNAHCRFDAASRTYEYSIYQHKDPFLQLMAHFYPFNVSTQLLQQFAQEILKHTEFEAFSKRSTQVHTFKCTVFNSEWVVTPGVLIYRVTANRFLRGMVKGLVGTMLNCASKEKSLEHFQKVLFSKDSSLVDFSVPSHGLTLRQVDFSSDKLPPTSF